MSWLFYALLSAVLGACAALLQKHTLKKEHAMEYSAVLAIFNLIFALPFFWFVEWEQLEAPAVLLTILGGIIAAFAFVLVAKSVRHLDVSISSPLLVLGPGIAALLAFIFLGEALTPLQIGGIILLIIGSYVLETRSHHQLKEPIKIFLKSTYVHLIIAGLLLYGFSANIDRYVLGHLNMQIAAFVAIVHLSIAVTMILLIMCFYDGFKGVKHGVRHAWLPIVIIAIFTVSYRYSATVAVSLAYIGLVEAVRKLSTLIVTVVGGELFNEKNLARKSLACVIMLCGAYFIVI